MGSDLDLKRLMMNGALDFKAAALDEAEDDMSAPRPFEEGVDFFKRSMLPESTAGGCGIAAIEGSKRTLFDESANEQVAVPAEDEFLLVEDDEELPSEVEAELVDAEVDAEDAEPAVEPLVCGCCGSKQTCLNWSSWNIWSWLSGLFNCEFIISNSAIWILRLVYGIRNLTEIRD